MIRLESNGMWLSLVERCVRDAEAASSNLVIPTKSLNRMIGTFIFVNINQRVHFKMLT